MDVRQMRMDRDEARERLVAYRQALRRRADEEYEAVVAGLEAMTEGHALIDLGEVIRDGGTDARRRPRLAVARADRRTVKWTQRRRDSWGEFDARSPRATVPSDTLQLRFDVGQNDTLDPLTWFVEGWAIVPMVPPEGVAVIGGGSYLRHHFVLWEVKEWADRAIQATPDRDPFLLARLGGDLYAVLHEWDLTEIERAVMAGRRWDG